MSKLMNGNSHQAWMPLETFYTPRDFYLAFIPQQVLPRAREEQVASTVKSLMPRTTLLGALTTWNMIIASVRRDRLLQDTRLWEMHLTRQGGPSSTPSATGAKRTQLSGLPMLVTRGEQQVILMMLGTQPFITTSRTNSLPTLQGLGAGTIQICSRLEMVVWITKKKSLISLYGLLAKHLLLLVPT